MPDPHAPPRAAHAPPMPLRNCRSWSPDAGREEAWLRRIRRRRRRSAGVTDEDLEELRACIELGFGFGPPEGDRRLSDTLPALELFYAVNGNFCSGAGLGSPDGETTPSPVGSPRSVFFPGENPQTMKTRLRQWAQVVACSVRQCSFSETLSTCSNDK